MFFVLINSIIFVISVIIIISKILLLLIIKSYKNLKFCKFISNNLYFPNKLGGFVHLSTGNPYVE